MTPEQLTRAALRCLAEIVLAASVSYWERRAAAFEAALPRPGDHLGGPVDYETGRPLTPGACQEELIMRVQAAVAECRSRAEELRADEWQAIR